jgi:alpha-tubulin suppressor-like RCC1 family protein
MKLRYFCLWTVVLALTLIFFAAACAAAAIKPTIAAGDNHTLSLQKDGSLWAWGYNDFGQLGLGDNTRRLTPVQVGTAKKLGGRGRR